jgi:hypothetical protein
MIKNYAKQRKDKGMDKVQLKYLSNKLQVRTSYISAVQNEICGVSKKFGEWSDILKATWARCVRMHMAIQRYIEKRHLA